MFRRRTGFGCRVALSGCAFVLAFLLSLVLAGVIAAYFDLRGIRLYSLIIATVIVLVSGAGSLQFLLFRRCPKCRLRKAGLRKGDGREVWSCEDCGAIASRRVPEGGFAAVGDLDDFFDDS